VIAFLADENFSRKVVRGLLLRDPTLTVLTVQQLGLGGAKDEVLLDYAARHGYVLLTHDAATVPPAAYARIVEGLPMSGVFVVEAALPVGEIVEELLLIAQCSEAEEWASTVCYLPL